MHCMIHREMLVAREQSPGLGDTVEIVTKVINFIKTQPLKSRVFQKLLSRVECKTSKFDVLLFAPVAIA